MVSEKAWKRLKQNLKTITRKTTPMSFDERIQKIKEVQRGWLNYFQGTSIYMKLRDLDGWLRNRLRYCIWKDWKKPERKRKNLIRLGVDQEHAYAWSRGNCPKSNSEYNNYLGTIKETWIFFTFGSLHFT